MKLSSFKEEQADDVVALFTKVFTDSEGKDEGALIGELVSDLINTTDEQELFGYVAQDVAQYVDQQEKITGSIFFSRLTLPSNKPAFILSPVAIATEQQRKGIGQQLINYGLEHLKTRGVELVFTYGDPAYYSKVGFKQISEDIIKAPLTLSYPEGWLVQSLANSVIEKEEGASSCVKALDNQTYW